MKRRAHIYINNCRQYWPCWLVALDRQSWIKWSWKFNPVQLAILYHLYFKMCAPSTSGLPVELLLPVIDVKISLLYFTLLYLFYMHFKLERTLRKHEKVDSFIPFLWLFLSCRIWFDWADLFIRLGGGGVYVHPMHPPCVRAWSSIPSQQVITHGKLPYALQKPFASKQIFQRNHSNEKSLILIKMLNHYNFNIFTRGLAFNRRQTATQKWRFIGITRKTIIDQRSLRSRFVKGTDAAIFAQSGSMG